MLDPIKNGLTLKTQLTHSPPHLVCKPPEVSRYGSAVIYMLLILSVGPIGADRGHLASSASARWEMKDLSLMFYNRCKCDGHKPNNIIHELQRWYKQPKGGGLCIRYYVSCDLMIYLLCPFRVQSITKHQFQHVWIFSLLSSLYLCRNLWVH